MQPFPLPKAFNKDSVAKALTKYERPKMKEMPAKNAVFLNVFPFSAVRISLGLKINQNGTNRNGRFQPIVPFDTRSLESFQIFLIELDMKPRLHLVEIP